MMDVDERAPTAVTPILQTNGLGFDTGGKRLIHDVSLSIRPHRRTVLMGPNGAGKSVLLRLLHGLLSPTSGAVFWHGRVLDAAARRDQAMVFQRPVLLRRSVRANLSFALAVRGIRGKRHAELEREALRRAHLEDLADRPARVLSGGEQQRLAITRALACAPTLLFLDEPTASLDPASTRAVEELIAEAHREGVTIVLVTHDTGQARRLGDDLIFLQDGQVAEVGPVSRALEHPRSAALIGWLEGRLFIGPET